MNNSLFLIWSVGTIIIVCFLGMNAYSITSIDDQGCRFGFNGLQKYCPHGIKDDYLLDDGTEVGMWKPEVLIKFEIVGIAILIVYQPLLTLSLRKSNKDQNTKEAT